MSYADDLEGLPQRVKDAILELRAIVEEQDERLLALEDDEEGEPPWFR